MQFNPSGSRTPWDASWHSPACTFASSLLCRLGCRRRHVGLVVFHRGAPLLRRLSALRFLVLFDALIARERPVLAGFDAIERRFASFKIFVFALIPAASASQHGESETR